MIQILNLFLQKYQHEVHTPILYNLSFFAFQNCIYVYFCRNIVIFRECYVQDYDNYLSICCFDNLRLRFMA
jgi:hypothetical protein